MECGATSTLTTAELTLYKLALKAGWLLPTANETIWMAGMNEREMLAKARKADFQACTLV